MPTAPNPTATWAASEADATAHLYYAGSSRCGHRATQTPPAPVGPAATRCPRCLRYSK